MLEVKKLSVKELEIKNSYSDWRRCMLNYHLLGISLVVAEYKCKELYDKYKTIRYNNVSFKNK